MSQQIRITVLVENTVYQPGLVAEHGLAYWIETEGMRILFDTGQGYALLHNVEILDVPLAQADAVVLSHGHFDHTGALDSVMNVARHSTVYVHPDAFQNKFSCRPNETRSIGCPCVIDWAQETHRFVWTKQPTAIGDSLFVTGEIPRRNGFEDVGGPFFQDPYGHVPDPLLDDQAIYFPTSKGWVVLLGCAHAGVVNTLDTIREQTGSSNIVAVIGGMHMVNADSDRIRKTLWALRDYPLELLVPAHCTGSQATAMLHKEFSEQWAPCSVGSVWEFDWLSQNETVESSQKHVKGS